MPLFGGGGGGFRRYLSGWGSRFVRELDDTMSTIRDTGHGESQKVAYDHRRTEPQTFEDMKQQCLDGGCLWEDPDFPASEESIYHTEPPSVDPGDIEWLRPGDICDGPEMFTEGASRMDVNQGILGDCWFLAAVAALSQHERLLHRVVPNDQNFTDDYAGIFRFEFWQYGRWVEVLIDDRLPTYNGKLIYMHSDEKNEFWTALLEKAFAKLHGCYENLSGGLTSEAMEDFTGGVVERFNFTENLPEDLFKQMLKAQNRLSLMGCSIDASPSELESQLDNGLIIGHAYTVTGVKLMNVETPSVSGEIPMVRCRNPWGNECEWKGMWSDQSEEWNYIAPEERDSMGLTFDHDGEFWMSYEDFTTNFQRLEICYLGPDTLQEGDSGALADDIQRWENTLSEGSWRRRVNAGGCPNYPESFWTNPQYRVTVTDIDDDDDDDMSTVIIGLMQRERRKMRSVGKDNMTIGYCVYELANPDSGTLGRRFFSSNRSVAKSPNFINMREVCGHHRLPPGEYVVVPSTFEPGEEADFVLRVFTEKETASREIDDTTAFLDGPGEDDEQPEVEIDEDKKGSTVEEFREKAGFDKELDAYELQEILNAAFEGEVPGFDGFNLEICRSLVAMRDADFTGKLGITEYEGLYNDLQLWKATFNMFDTDGGGFFNSYELRRALNTIAHVMIKGLRLSNSAFNAIVMRYSDKEGHVSFEDFISCVVKLKNMFETFKLKEQDGGEEGQATFMTDEFIALTMYS